MMTETQAMWIPVVLWVSAGLSTYINAIIKWKVHLLYKNYGVKFSDVVFEVSMLVKNLLIGPFLLVVIYNLSKQERKDK